MGKGSLAKLPEIAQKLGGTHGFIISGPHLNKMGIVKSCADALGGVGIPVDAYTETEGNPSVETVDKAAEAFKKSGADFCCWGQVRSKIKSCAARMSGINIGTGFQR